MDLAVAIAVTEANGAHPELCIPGDHRRGGRHAMVLADGEQLPPIERVKSRLGPCEEIGHPARHNVEGAVVGHDHVGDAMSQDSKLLAEANIRQIAVGPHAVGGAPCGNDGVIFQAPFPWLLASAVLVM